MGEESAGLDSASADEEPLNTSTDPQSHSMGQPLGVTDQGFSTNPGESFREVFC